MRSKQWRWPFTHAVTSTCGSALVELALCLPLLALTLIGTVDFARVFYTAIALTDAARAGAQYGAYNVAHSGNAAMMVTTAIGATNLPEVTAVASRVCQCADDDGAFKMSNFPMSGAAGETACTAPVSFSCHYLEHRVMTVTVTATKEFRTIAGFIGIPQSLTLSRSATLRVSE